MRQFSYREKWKKLLIPEIYKDGAWGNNSGRYPGVGEKNQPGDGRAGEIAEDIKEKILEGNIEADKKFGFVEKGERSVDVDVMDMECRQN